MRLAITELIANVVRHGGVAPDERMQLNVKATSSTLTVRLRQPTHAARAGVDEYAAMSLPEGGWGLMIVEELTDRWGIIPGPPGEVWFELDIR